MLIQENLTLQQKLEILSDAAKDDVACTSSGADRRGKKGTIGSAVSCGICHSFAADGRCISLLKILLTNECIYDCRYCVNRISNDTVRTSFTPEEICTLTMEFYRRNYIEGLFLSSGILRTPNYTMEQIYQALFLPREKYRFWGYIHVKAIPGADPELIERVGHLADRMSINLELPTGDGLKKLAPAKTRERILTPMRQIQKGIRQDQYMVEERRREKKIYLGSGASASGGRSHTAAQSDASFCEDFVESRSGGDEDFCRWNCFPFRNWKARFRKHWNRVASFCAERIALRTEITFRSGGAEHADDYRSYAGDRSPDSSGYGSLISEI